MNKQFFTPKDLQAMKETQEAHMMDTCKIETRVQTVDSFGQMVESFPTDSEEVRCGLDMQPGTERHNVDGSVISYDATIRLPMGTAVTSMDKVKITKRFGVRLDVPLVYEVMSPIQQGPSGTRYALRKLVV